MARDPDEDALSWAGDADRPGGTAESPAPRQEPERAPDSVAVARAGQVEGRRLALTATLGVIAGIYLVFTVFWIIGVQLTGGSPRFLLGAIMFQFGEFLAIVCCALWFGVTIVLTRGSSFAVRILWLLAGLVVLIPWPFFLGIGS